MSRFNLSQIIELQSFFPYRLSILEQVVSEQVATSYKDDYQLMRNDWRALATLAMAVKREEPMTATDIGSFTKMEKMQVSRAIQRLKANDLLVSEENPNDKRTCYYSLSDKGKEVYAAVLPNVKEKEQHILASLSDVEKAQLSSLLDKLEHHLQIHESVKETE